MTAPLWQTPVGFLGTLTKNISTSVSVVATGPSISYALISGSLPSGLSLNRSTGAIVGTPAPVAQVTSSTFVIRAANTGGISDRTFVVDISGPTAPEWVTSSGALPVGPNGELYTLNKEWVDYTVNAEVDILTGGNRLSYYIPAFAGQLPPGLTLTESGRIYGFVSDQLQLNAQASPSGGYDSEKYDGYPYDHGNENISNPLVKPESIKKIYQFTVMVTDGILSASQPFTIEVADPNSLRADNSIIDVDSTDYLSSVSYLLPPLWQNSQGINLPKVANLGTIRASRNQIITLHDYDPYPFVGTVSYDWSSTVNPELPLLTDSQFIIGRPTTNLKNQNQVYFKNTSILPIAGMGLNLSEFIPADPVTYNILGVEVISSTVTNGTIYYTGYINLDQPLKNTIPDSTEIYVGSLSQHPPGMQLDTVTGELYGQLPYQPAYSVSYRFTIKLIKTDQATGHTVSNSQIFILTIKGTVDSAIQWISTSSLGTLLPDQISELSIQAVNINSPYSIEYTLITGMLPPGLALYPDGTIQGKVPSQVSTSTYTYNFTVQASDVYLTSAITQPFTIVVQDSINEYTQMYVRPFLPVDQRTIYRSFVSNATIFNSANLYRPNDPNFGIQTSIQMLIETGIQSIDINLYATAMQEFFSRKKFYFGDVKSIVAQDSTRTPVYELVYVDIIDPQMIGNHSPSYAISVANMQSSLESIVLSNSQTIEVNENLQPKYMTTIQPVTGLEIGFVKAVPICYALPGQSANIISLIKASGFDFKQFDFDTDRIIVETNTATGYATWLAFPNQ